jgi:hypothetical protein
MRKDSDKAYTLSYQFKTQMINLDCNQVQNNYQ